ncbi:MAG: hypothetical protein HKN13_11355 [Rhodothermales bacterium]|nr:hypothetical protein [Rhodothermales bacterium]
MIEDGRHAFEPTGLFRPKVYAASRILPQRIGDSWLRKRTFRRISAHVYAEARGRGNRPERVQGLHKELAILFEPDMFWFDRDREHGAEEWKAAALRDFLLRGMRRSS